MLLKTCFRICVVVNACLNKLVGKCLLGQKIWKMHSILWEIQRWNIDLLTFVPRGQIWTMSQVFDLRAVGQKNQLDFKLWTQQIQLDSSTFDVFNFGFSQNWFSQIGFFKKTLRGQSPVLHFFKKKCFEFWHSFFVVSRRRRRQLLSSSSSLRNPPPPPPPPPRP